MKICLFGYNGDSSFSYEVLKCIQFLLTNQPASQWTNDPTENRPSSFQLLYVYYECKLNDLWLLGDLKIVFRTLSSSFSWMWLHLISIQMTLTGFNKSLSIPNIEYTKNSNSEPKPPIEPNGRKQTWSFINNHEKSYSSRSFT